MVLGEWNRRVDGETVVRVHKVALQIRHPSYSSRTYDNDIALWKLSQPADLSFFRTVCLSVPGIALGILQCIRVYKFWLLSITSNATSMAEQIAGQKKSMQV